MICTRCKADLTANSSYCPVCGKRVKNRDNEGRPAFRIYTNIMLLLYASALFVCLICNFVIQNTLSWFFIVLASTLLCFSITNLPFLFKKHRLAIAAAAVTLLLYFLLFTCYLISPGAWLLSVAFPIATFVLFFAWLILLTVRYLKVRWGYKIALLFLFSGLFIAMFNPLLQYLLSDESSIIAFLSNNSRGSVYTISLVLFLCMLIGAGISVVVSLTATLQKNQTD